MLKSVRFLNKQGETVTIGEGWVFMCGGNHLFIFSPEGEMMKCDEKPQNYYGQPDECWDVGADAAWFAERFLLILAAALGLGLQAFGRDDDDAPGFACLDYGDRRIWRLVKLPA